MLITDGGTLVRTRVDGISVVGRYTQDETIIRLDKKEKVIGVDRIEGLAGEDEDEDEIVDVLLDEDVSEESAPDEMDSEE